MKKLICVAIMGIIGFAACAGINGGNQQTGGDDMLNRPPNVAYEGTGLKDPNSEL